MKEGWSQRRLGEVTSFQNGFAFKSTLFRKDGLPIVRISSIQDEEIKDDDLVTFYPSDYDVDFDNYKILPNDILIAMSGGTTGKLGINRSNKIYYQNQRVGVIREIKQYLLHSYLYYFLHTKSEESLRIAAGAAQPNLSTAQIKDFVIPLPSLSEQQRIVGILDAEFEKIDALKANAEKNLQNAKDLFQAALKKELEPKEGWITSTLQHLLKLTSGDNLTTKAIKPGPYPVYGGNGIMGYHNDYNLDGQNVIVGRVGALCGNVKLIDGKIWYTDNAFLVNDKSGLFYLPYLAYVLTSTDLRQYATQAAQPVISNVSMKDVVLSVPQTAQEQHAIVSRLDSTKRNCDALQDNFAQTIALCDALKQALLRKAFNGEL